MGWSPVKGEECWKRKTQPVFPQHRTLRTREHLHVQQAAPRRFRTLTPGTCGRDEIVTAPVIMLYDYVP